MTQSTFYSSGGGDGCKWCNSGSYSTARRMTGTIYGNDTADYNSCGQYYESASTNYYVYEYFVSFDTSSIPDTDTIDSVELSFWDHYPWAWTHFTLQVRAYDWGPTLENADVRSGDPADANSLDEYPLVATYNTTSGWGAHTQYRVFTSESAFVNHINKTGTSYFIVHSSRQLSGNAPTSHEQEVICNSEEVTGEPPRLVVNHTAAGGADVVDPMGMMGFFGA